MVAVVYVSRGRAIGATYQCPSWTAVGPAPYPQEPIRGQRGPPPTGILNNVSPDPAPAGRARPAARTGLSTVVIVTAAAVAGLVLAAATFYVGWQLPHRVECGGGDSCQSTLAIDWDRVDWSLPPQRIACGVPHPGPENVLMAPGDVCISGRSDGTDSTQVTYEQIRDRTTQRRALTLVVAGLILIVTTIAAVTVARRRRPGGTPAAPAPPA
jgi:hypothetical protein